MTATELYAASQSTCCEGKYECHWCAAPCSNAFAHDDPPPIPFKRSCPSPSRRPNNPWICKGCWLFRRKSVTVNYLDGTSLDKQCPLNHSWLITPKGAWAISKKQLFSFLIKPDCCFALSLLKNEPLNLLSLVQVNNHSIIQATTPLLFSLDNIQLTYTIYELVETSNRETPGGHEPGVRLLIDFLGPMPREPEMKKRGRPTLKGDFDKLVRTITVSGTS